MKLPHLIASLLVVLCSLVSLSSASQGGGAGLTYHDALREAAIQERGWQLTTRSSAFELPTGQDGFFHARDVASATTTMEDTLNRRAAAFEADVLEKLIARGKDAKGKGGQKGSASQLWGQGPYQTDLNDYHKNIKPQLLSAFNKLQAEGKLKMPGSNPDFHIDRKGMVQASATGGKSFGRNEPMHIADLGLAHLFPRPQ